MRVLTLFVVLSTAWQSYAQNLSVRYRPCNPCGTNLNDDFNYEDTIVFPTESVISDYGIRHTNIQGASVFHQAIDYTVRGMEDAKYALKAVQGGKVDSITNGNEMAKGYKIMMVGGYGYGHIFTNSQTDIARYGKFLLAKLDNILLNEWGIIDLEFCRCFAKTPNQKVTIDGLDLKFCNTKTFTTTNQVETGWDIAPLGVSGTKSSHLHLERYVGGTGRKADPNQYVAHAETNFEVILKSETSNDNEINLTYPGTKPTPLRVRAKMIGATKFPPDGYTNVTMSADNVGILLERNPHSAYEEIVGPTYNSRISHGARDDSPITPWSSSVFNTRHKAGFGSWKRTGIKPYAHNDVVTPANLRNEPYDDYYFTDFYTRIHKEKRNLFANLPSNARYNDGHYKLKPTVTNVRDELFTIPSIPFSIDNFKPYIEKFEVYNSSAIYQLERSEVTSKTATDSGYVANKIYAYPASLPSSGQSDININIVTSEPMQNIHFAYKRYNENNYSPPILMQINSSDIMKWTGSFSVINQNTDLDSFNVRFYGQDFATNNLLNIYKKSNNNNPSKSVIIPIRTGNGPQDWKHHLLAESGFDQIDFAIKNCTGRSGATDYCAILSNMHVSDETHNCTSAKIKVHGLENNQNDFSITWSDENGQILEEYDNLTQFYPVPGTYCYNITALYSCCHLEGCVEISQEALNDQLQIQTTVQRHACDVSNGAAFVSSVILNGENVHVSNSNFTFKWSNGSTILGINAPAGTYIVTVTDKIYGCSNTAEVVIEEIQIDLQTEISPSGCEEGGSIWVFPEYSHDFISEDDLRYEWSNGSTTDFIDDLIPGTYCVTVSYNVYSNCSFTKCFEITPFNVIANVKDICLQGTGSISLEVSGGTEPYTYKWSNDRSGLPTITGKNSGIHSVTIIDNNGCSMVREYEIKIKELDLSGIISNPTLCSLDETSDIELMVLNGKEPFVYQWSSGETSKLIQNKKEGIYHVSVKDNEGCGGSASFEVVRDVMIFPVGTTPGQTSILKHDCNGLSVGRIYMHNFPGSGLTYEWENQGQILPFTSRSVSNLPTSVYCVTATANGNCQTSACFEIKNVAVIETNPVQHIACGSKGSIGLIEPLPYFDDPEIQQYSTYKWSHDPNYTQASAFDLAEGMYRITITNNHPQLANECTTRIFEYRIQQYSQISITGTVTNGMQGPNIMPPSGKIEIQVSEGSGDFSFKWRLSNSNQIISVSQNLLNVPSGSYEIEVKDNITNCITRKVFFVNNINCNSNLFSIHAIFTDPHNNCFLDGHGPINGNFNDCTIGCPKRFKIVLNIFSNQAFPLKARVTGANGYNEEITVLKDDLINSHTFYWPKKLNVSLTPYKLQITDRCNNAVEQEFWACTPCTPPVKSGNFINFSSGITIELVRVDECKFRNPLFARKSQLAIFKGIGINISKGLEVTIVWPNNKTAKFTNTGSGKTKTVNGSQMNFELNEEMFKNGTPLIIKEIRSDGCVQQIELAFGVKTRNVEMLQRILSEPPFPAFTANRICEKCNPAESIEPPKYLETCADNDKGQMVEFKYKPHNWNAPCSGGGTFLAHVIENKKVLENIPVICSPSVLISTAAYHPAHPGDQLTVADGGGCLFNTLPTFGFVSQKPMYVNWWRILKVTKPFPPDHTTTGPSPCPKINVTSNGDNFIIKTENEKLDAGLVIIYPDKTEKSYPLTYGFDEFTVKKIMSGEYIFILKAPQPCTDKIIKSSHDGEILECPGIDDLKIVKFYNSVIDFQLNSKISRSNCKVRIIRDFDNSIVGHSDFNLGVGINNLSVELQIVAPYAFTMIIEISGCSNILKHFPIGAFTSDDPPSSDIASDCDDDILNLVYDPVNDNYEYYWINHVDNTYQAYGAKIDANLALESDPIIILKQPLSNAFNGQIISAGHDVYLFSGNNNSSASLTTIDSIGFEQTQLFPDRVWSSVVQGYAAQELHVLYYVISEDRYYHETWAYDGRLIRSEPVSSLLCDHGRINCATYQYHINGQYTSIDTSAISTRISWYDNTVRLREAVLAPEIKVKKVQPWQQNQWLVSGDMRGQVTLSNGKSYDTEGYNNLIFIWYDDQAAVTDVKLIRRNRHEVLTHAATDALSRVAYTGIYTDTISYSDDPDLIETESCIFGDGFVQDSIPDAACPAVISVDTEDNSCFTIHFETDTFTQIQIRYDYYGYIDQEFGLVFSETIPYTLSAQGDSVQYCRNQNVEHFYWSIEYFIECTNCRDNCLSEGNLMLLARPGSNNQSDNRDIYNRGVTALQQRSVSEISEPMYFPNPFQKGINLSVQSRLQQSATLIVWDSYGIPVFTKYITLGSGQNIYYIDETEKLPSGVYIFEMQVEEIKSVKRVIKLE